MMKSSEKPETTIALPREILYRIFNLLNQDDLAKCLLVSKQLKHLASITTRNWSYSRKGKNNGVRVIVKLFPNVTDFSLRCCGSVTPIALKYLSSLDNLSALNLSYCKIDDLSSLLNMKDKLKHLAVSMASEDLLKLTNLQSLSLVEVSFLPMRLSSFTKFSELTSLNLTNFGAELNGLETLTTLTKLEILSYKFRFSRHIAENINSLTNLRVLNLGHNLHFADDHIPLLSDLTKLEELDVRGCFFISDVGFNKIPQHLNNIHTLCLRRLDITDAGLEEFINTSILTMKNLHSIDISETKVTLDNVQKIRSTLLKNANDLKNGTTTNPSSSRMLELIYNNENRNSDDEVDDDSDSDFDIQLHQNLPGRQSESSSDFSED